MFLKSEIQKKSIFLTITLDVYISALDKTEYATKICYVLCSVLFLSNLYYFYSTVFINNNLWILTDKNL